MCLCARTPVSAKHLYTLSGSFNNPPLPAACQHPCTSNAAFSVAHPIITPPPHLCQNPSFLVSLASPSLRQLLFPVDRREKDAGNYECWVHIHTRCRRPGSQQNFCPVLMTRIPDKCLSFGLSRPCLWVINSGPQKNQEPCGNLNSCLDLTRILWNPEPETKNNLGTHDWQGSIWGAR